MDAIEFVQNWKNEKDSLLDMFMNSNESYTANIINSMELSITQREQMYTALNSALTDTMYTLLLGLDGEASIGGIQHCYKILDEDNNVISQCGDIECAAYDAFHGENQ